MRCTHNTSHNTRHRSYGRSICVAEFSHVPFDAALRQVSNDFLSASL